MRIWQIAIKSLKHSVLRILNDPLLANAVSQMAGYIKERFPATYPSKEQTEAVNAYLDSVCLTSHIPMTEVGV